jgi:hypothetical protein
MAAVRQLTTPAPQAHLFGRSGLPAELAKLDRFDLLVLDDVSYVRRDQAETSVLFELIAEQLSPALAGVRIAPVY